MGAAQHQGCPHIQKWQGLVHSLVTQASADPDLFTLSVHFPPPPMVIQMPYSFLFIFCCFIIYLFFLRYMCKNVCMCESGYMADMCLSTRWTYVYL